MSAKKTFRRFSATTAPVLDRLGCGALLDAGVKSFSFFRGQGAGAGWDHKNEIAIAARLVRGHNPVIFDVGANKGLWSASLSNRLRNPGAQFYLFEVAPYCFSEIAERKSSIVHCELIKAAVSDKDGVAILHAPAEFSGLASLHKRSDASVIQRDYQEVEVATRTLTSFCHQRSIDHISFLKMDIEGHELFALRGAEELIRQRKIGALTFEFGSANVNSRTFFRDFWDFFSKHDYHLHRMIPGGRLVPIHSYSEQLEYFRGATNYVAECLT